MSRPAKPIGPTLLAAAIASRKITNADVARAVDVSREVVRQWLDGDCVPASENRVRLALATQGDVPAESWGPLPAPAPVQSLGYGVK